MSTLPQTRLPVEVITAILKHLPQDELRRASRASRDFYSAAHDAGLFLHRRVHSERQNTLSTFSTVVKHAQAQRQMFRLGLTLMVFRRGGGYTTDLPSLRKIWDKLRLAIPFLVSLDVKLYSAHIGAAYTALDAPAPQLRRLSILVLDKRAVPAHIPVTLFGCKAPRLRNVELSGPVLPLALTHIPAWSGVRELTARVHSAGQQLPVAAHFPALCDIVLEIYPQSNPLIVDLGGLALDSLTVNDDSRAGVPLQYAFDASTPPPRIRTVNYLCGAVRYDERLWPGADVLLNAHIQQTVYDMGNGNCTQYKRSPLDFPTFDAEQRVRTGETVSLSSADDTSDWRLTQYTKPAPPSDASRLSALDALPPLRARLVSLTIDDALLVRLLQTPCTLEVLAELYVDCTMVPAPPPRRERLYAPPRLRIASPPRLRCPTLERITLFATGLDTTVYVRRKRIAALALLRRVALVLVRVIADDGDALQDAFSSVHVAEAQAASCIPAYYRRREDNPRLGK